MKSEIDIICPFCGTRHQPRIEWAHYNLKCRKCSQMFSVNKRYIEVYITERIEPKANPLGRMNVAIGEWAIY